MARKTLSAMVGLLLTASSVVHAQVVNFSGINLQTNIGSGTGSIVMDGTRLRMTDGEYETARSALSTSTFNLSGSWSTSYRMNFSCQGVGLNPDPEVNEVICPGDGIGFVATAGNEFQVGGGGYDLGYGGSFDNSVTFGSKTFWNFADFGENGAWTLGCCGNPTLSNNFEDFFDVLLSYDGSMLSATVTQVGTSQVVYSGSYLWTAPAWAANARVGFTSSSGLASEYSWVSDWTLNETRTTAPEPASLVLLAFGGAILVTVARCRQRIAQQRS